MFPYGGWLQNSAPVRIDDRRIIIIPKTCFILTKWDQRIAKLVKWTPTTMAFGTHKWSFKWFINKPSYNWWSHIVNMLTNWSSISQPSTKQRVMTRKHGNIMQYPRDAWLTHKEEWPWLSYMPCIKSITVMWLKHTKAIRNQPYLDGVYTVQTC